MDTQEFKKTKNLSVQKNNRSKNRFNIDSFDSAVLCDILY